MRIIRDGYFCFGKFQGYPFCISAYEEYIWWIKENRIGEDDPVFMEETKHMKEPIPKLTWGKYRDHDIKWIKANDFGYFQWLTNKSDAFRKNERFIDYIKRNKL